MCTYTLPQYHAGMPGMVIKSTVHGGGGVYSYMKIGPLSSGTLINNCSVQLFKS